MNNQALEFYKCRQNPFYFIYNYVYIPEIGSTLKYTEDIIHAKLKRLIKCVYNLHYVLLMASRQLGKSTIAAALIEWALNFFPGSKSIILNMQRDYAFENLNKIKFIHENLPDYIKVPLKNKAERKTYIEYDHGSVVKVFYPATVIKPDTIGRSLSVPILYIDEAAFISYIDEIFAAAAPTLLQAKAQAIKNGMPYFILMSTTPNGVEGTGKWFHSMWSNAIDSDEIFNENHNFVPNYKQLISESVNKNNFVRIKYHWSEDSTKNNDWYLEQQRLLNFDKRKINQELDLVFLGGDNCIFDDETLSALTSKKPIDTIELGVSQNIKFYEPLSNLNYYIIGIDTAKTITGDMCSIEIFDYQDFNQVAEFQGRLGSVTLFIDCIRTLLTYIENTIGRRFYLAIENNSFGNQVVEDLEDDYSDIIFSPDDRWVGINTNSKTKKIMISIIYDKIKNNPEIINSADLISQLNIMQRKSNGSISAASGYHDDLFMASAISSYCYEMTYDEVIPLLNIKDLSKLDKKIVNITASSALLNTTPNTSKLANLIYSSEQQLIENSDIENFQTEIFI